MLKGLAIPEYMDEQTEFAIAKLIEIDSTNRIISVEDQINENKGKKII